MDFYRFGVLLFRYLLALVVVCGFQDCGFDFWVCWVLWVGFGDVGLVVRLI